MITIQRTPEQIVMLRKILNTRAGRLQLAEAIIPSLARREKKGKPFRVIGLAHLCEEGFTSRQQDAAIRIVRAAIQLVRATR